MSTSILGHYLAAGVLLSSLVVHGASAQFDSTACAAAGARLGGALTRLEYGNALGTLRRCPSVGPAFIAGAWLAPPTDSANLSVLTYVSGNYREERVFRALTVALLDDAQPRAVRLAATSALITQAFPCSMLGSSQTVRDGDSLYTFVSLFNTAGNSGAKRSSSVEGEPLSRVLKAFRDLASTSSDRTMRSHAVGVLRELSRPGMKERINCTP